MTSIKPLSIISNVLTVVLWTEIIRVSGVVPNHGFGDYDRMHHGSPSPMASPNINIGGTGFGGWHGIQQEVYHHIPSNLQGPSF